MARHWPVRRRRTSGARGDGNKYVSLGFEDFACTPITRQNILATLGKYLGFEPITTPAN